jgi:hypothetical protein
VDYTPLGSFVRPLSSTGSCQYRGPDWDFGLSIVPDSLKIKTRYTPQDPENAMRLQLATYYTKYHPSKGLEYLTGLLKEAGHNLPTDTMYLIECINLAMKSVQFAREKEGFYLSDAQGRPDTRTTALIEALRPLSSEKGNTSLTYPLRFHANNSLLGLYYASTQRKEALEAARSMLTWAKGEDSLTAASRVCYIENEIPFREGKISPAAFINNVSACQAEVEKERAARIKQQAPAPKTEASFSGDFTVYPNPARQNITAVIKDASKPVFTLLDASGRAQALQQVSATGQGVYTFDVSSLPEGIYALQFTTPQGVKRQKLTVVK